MIKHKNQYETVEIKNMRGGEGSCIATKLLSDGEFCPNFRLFNIMRLEKGCSIGLHPHVKETEYYYILSGNGIVIEDDGEKTVKEGDLVITGNGGSHSIINNNTEPLIFVAAIITE